MLRTMPYMIPARLDHLWPPTFIALELSAGLFRHQRSVVFSLLLCRFLSISLFHYVLRSANPRSFHPMLRSLFVSLSLGRSTLHTTFYNIPAGLIRRLTPIYLLSLCLPFFYISFLSSVSFPPALGACSGTVSVYMRISFGASCT